MRSKPLWGVLFFLAWFIRLSADAQWSANGSVVVRGHVTFVSSASAYLDVGKDRGAAPGDSVVFIRGGQVQAEGTITAVSSGSSVVPVKGDGLIRVGDSVLVRHQRPAVNAEQSAATLTRTTQAFLAPRAVTGRVALQYIGAGSVKEGISTSQPAMVLLLNIPALFESGLSMRFHGRTARDFSRERFSGREGSRTSTRIYELAFASDAPGRTFGFSFGRVMSRYVSGLGSFDGAELLVRKGNLTAGLVGGFQPDLRTSGIDGRRQTVAIFGNMTWSARDRTGGDVTLAYGRQMFKGKLDRDYAYIQSSTRIGETLSLFQSTEVDVTGMEGEVRTEKFRLTNTFFTLSYGPTPWLNIDGGYDATRTVYYLESMNIRSDTLMDNSIRQGLRAGVSVRLPLRLRVGGRMYVRSATGDLRASRTIIGMAGMSDIGRTGISTNVQLAGITGIYAEGTNLSARLNYMSGAGLNIDLGIERYAYTLVRTGEQSRTLTASVSVQSLIAQRWYLLGGFDQIWEDGIPFQRIFAEVGVRF